MDTTNNNDGSLRHFTSTSGLRLGPDSEFVYRTYVAEGANGETHVWYNTQREPLNGEVFYMNSSHGSSGLETWYETYTLKNYPESYT